MNDDELAAISALAEAATPGPWSAVAPPQDRWHDDDGEWWVEFSHGDSTLMGEADAEFIVAARSAVPALVAALAEARAELIAHEKRALSVDDRWLALIRSRESALAEAHRTLADRDALIVKARRWVTNCVDPVEVGVDVKKAMLAELAASRSGAAETCVCDGASYNTPEQNRERRPFLVNGACPVHARSGAESAGEQR